MAPLLNDGRPFLTADHGVLGMSGWGLRSALREHRLRSVMRGVVVDATVPDTRSLRIASCRLVVPRHAVICDCSAAWLYGVDAFKPGDRYLLTPSYVVPHGSTRCTSACVQCREAHIPDADVCAIDGLAVTSPVRTTADLLRKQWRPYALAAADGMAHAGLADPVAVFDFVQRLRGYPGVVQARDLAGLIEPRAESAGESWQRLRLLDAGFPRPHAQFEVVDQSGRSRFLDLAYPEVRIAIEYDGAEFHTSDRDRSHDLARRSFLSEAYGWRFAIARKGDIFGDDPAVERTVGGWLGRAPLPRSW